MGESKIIPHYTWYPFPSLSWRERLHAIWWRRFVQHEGRKEATGGGWIAPKRGFWDRFMDGALDARGLWYGRGRLKKGENKNEARG